MSGIMLAITLDTSCVLNFLGQDDNVDDALVELVALAIAGGVNLNATEHAHTEVARTADEQARANRLARLRAFGKLELASHLHVKRDRLAQELHNAIFPQAQPGSRTDDHNRRDCLQLATHVLLGRDLFCTLDGKLLARASKAVDHLAICSPNDALEHIERARLRDQPLGVSALAVRDAELDRDESSIREVLRPLADDYPGFGQWLTKALAKTRRGEARIRVGLHRNRVGAVSLSTLKDERVVKLSAFYVTEDARQAGLGQHLLWSEIRTWATGNIAKAYVTISSRHRELIGFFHEFGFVIEGMSPRRYQADTAEIVLGKHMVHEVISDADLEQFSAGVARHIFAAPEMGTRDRAAWALPPATKPTSLHWRGEGSASALVEETSPNEVRRGWSMLDLERTFHPLRFSLKDRRALVVPIRPHWARAMLEYRRAQPSLFEDVPEKLLLRSDNAYYCYPKCLPDACAGTPILFYVTGGTGLVGEARIIDSVVGPPEELYTRFGGLGVYGVSDIRKHVAKRGVHRGEALALRFGLYVPFLAPLSIQEARETLDRQITLQGLSPISHEDYEVLRRRGGLKW